MKQKTYKILVLSDLKNSVNSALNNSVSLAKMINADVDFFHVKKATEIVETDNQLSAKRTINRVHFDIDKKIEKLVKPFITNHDLKINTIFSFGNVKDEILKRIEKSQPDIIVLGQRKGNAFKILGDNMANFILKNYNGTILIASEKNGLEPQKELALGVLNSVEESFNISFANELMSHTKKPLKAFKIVEKTANQGENLGNREIIEYVFEKNDNTVNNLSNYLKKNKINLFCLNREDTIANGKSKAMTSQFKDVINKLDVSLLLSNGDQKFMLN